MEILTFALVLRGMSALPKILLLCQRLGATITYIAAADGRANLVLSAPRHTAHRLGPQIRRIIDVVGLTELHMAHTGTRAKHADQERFRQTA